MLEAALAAGIASAGGDVAARRRPADAGRAAAAGRYGFDLAAVISASHNPYRDNGIKFFAADGYKLSDDDRGARSRRALERAPPPPSDPIGRVRALHGTLEDYLRALHERFARARPDRPRRRCSTARTARPTASRPRSSAASARRSPRSTTPPTGATSTRAAARPTSTRSPQAVARRRPRRRLRLRRRRRPRAGRRPQRRRRRRRRAHRARRPAPARRPAACPATASRSPS